MVSKVHIDLLVTAGLWRREEWNPLMYRWQDVDGYVATAKLTPTGPTRSAGC